MTRVLTNWHHQLCSVTRVTVIYYELNIHLINMICCVASNIFNEGFSTDYLNNVRAVIEIVNENIFN